MTIQRPEGTIKLPCGARCLLSRVTRCERYRECEPARRCDCRLAANGDPHDSRHPVRMRRDHCGEAVNYPIFRF